MLIWKLLSRLVGFLATVIDFIQVGNLVVDGLPRPIPSFDVGVLGYVFWVLRNWSYNYPPEALLVHVALVIFAGPFIYRLPIRSCIIRLNLFWWLTGLPFVYYLKLAFNNMEVIWLVLSLAILMAPPAIIIAAQKSANDFVLLFNAFLTQLALTIIFSIGYAIFLNPSLHSQYFHLRILFYSLAIGLAVFFVYFSFHLFVKHNCEQMSSDHF